MTQELSRRGFVRLASSAAAAAAAVSSSAQPAQEPVPVAMVGCAHIHVPSFISILNSRQDLKVKAVWDHDTSRAGRRAEELKAPAVRNADEIWSDAQIQAVFICSETNRHRELVLAAAKARKHMFVEKPLGVSASDSRIMAEAIEEANVLFSTGYISRSFPQVLFVKQQIEKGTFGKITRARAAMCHEGALGGWFDTEWRWMADPQQAGVGAFGDLGTHSLDVLMWLLGDVEAVAAQIQTVTRRYGDCDETGEALIRFRNGAVGTLAAGWVDRANPLTLLISGTDAHAAVINDQVYIRTTKGPIQSDGRTAWRELPARLPHPFEIFLNAIVGQRNQPLVTAGEAASRVVVMEAMYRAAREGKWITVG